MVFLQGAIRSSGEKTFNCKTLRQEPPMTLGEWSFFERPQRGACHAAAPPDLTLVKSIINEERESTERDHIFILGLACPKSGVMTKLLGVIKIIY